MQPIAMSRTPSFDRLNDLSSSRILSQTNTRTLPVTIMPSQSVVTITQSTTHTQTTQEIQSAVTSKSVPSFAETQLLSVYYPTSGSVKTSNNDKCVFFEEQNRQPVRSRASYDPSAPAKSTQTSPLSTHSSTLVIDRSHKPYPNYKQYVKLQSGSQNLGNEKPDEHASPKELIDESNYSYEEYIVQVDKNETAKDLSASSSPSSVTTVIEQNQKRNPYSTSPSTIDDLSLSSSIQSSSTDAASRITSQRTSNWRPIPTDIVDVDNHRESDEQGRSTRVQFADKLVHVMPTSSDTEIVSESVSSKNSDEKRPSTNLDSHQVKQQLQRFDFHPVNQSKWIQNHIDQSDIQTNSTSKRVNALRSIFEPQNVSSSDSPTLHSPRYSKQRVEYNVTRSQSKESNISTIHRAQPVQVVQQTSQDDSSNGTPFKLDQIRQITGKPLKHINDVGHYLQDGRTWQWNEVFWLSLTNAQRDQLTDLENQINARPRSANHSSTDNTSSNLKNVKHVTVASTSVKPKPSANTVITTISSSNPPESTAPSSTIIKQETVIVPVDRNQNEKLPTTQIDPLSYEQFVCDYLTDYGKQIRANNNSLVLSIDQYQIPLPTSKHDSSVTKNIYIDLIDRVFPPFETESNQIVIFISGTVIVIPADRYTYYRKKYQNAAWLKNLKRVNRDLPPASLPSIEHWLADHTKFAFDKNQMNVDGTIVPFIGQYGSKIMNSDRDCFWNETLKYLIHIGYASYNAEGQMVNVTDCELDIHRILAPPLSDLVERVAKYLQTLKGIDFENGKLIITKDFILPNQYVQHLLKSTHQDQSIYPHELAAFLLQICVIDEDETDQSLILQFNKQSLRISDHANNFDENHIDALVQWLNKLNQNQLIQTADNNDITIYPNNQKNPEQQILIKHEYVARYLKEKSTSNRTDVLQLIDIANILLSFNYVQHSSGQLIFPKQNIILDTNELVWLKSIIKSTRPNDQTQKTEIELFDGESTHTIQISYEHLPATKDANVVADYLFHNGDVRYDADTGSYIYRYVPPNQKNHSAEYSKQYHILSSHIRNVHIDKNQKRILIEFMYDPNHYLTLPAYWYQTMSDEQFSRSFIVHSLLANGGQVNQDHFRFNDQVYSLKLTNKQKENLIDYYVEYVNDHGVINYDNTKHILILENPSDSSKLHLTREHSDFIQKNKYQRKDMKSLLVQHSEITKDEFNNWLLSYNDQCIQLPLGNPINDNANGDGSRQEQVDLLHRYHATIDYMYHNNLITFDKHLKFYQIHFTNETLAIPYNDLRSILQATNTNTALPFSSLQFSNWLLKNSDQINSTRDNQIELIYKNKSYYLPTVPSYTRPVVERQETNANLDLIFPSNNSLRSIQKTPSTTTLDIEQPSSANNYMIDPLLILANYVHRAASLYQDELGRLIIKLNKNEIAIPRVEAMDTIEAIRTSPQRTGTIIARLLHRIGKVQSNRNGGIIITIANISFELSKEVIEASQRSFVENNRSTPVKPSAGRSPILPTLKTARSVGSLSSIDGASRFNHENQQTTYTKDGRGDARFLNLISTESSSSSSRSIHIVRRKDEIHVYIQYRDEHDMAYDNVSNMVRPIQSQIIDPNRYQDRTLRDVAVYVSRLGEEKVYYDNLAEYLASERPYLSPATVYHLLNFSSRNEYLTYLSKKMSPVKANELLKKIDDFSSRTRPSNQQSKFADAYENYRHRSKSLDQLFEPISFKSNSRSPPSVNGTGIQSLITHEKNVTLPRSSTLSGQSNDGESEGRTTVSRSASAVAKATTSKSDTLKSNTSSSGPSSREQHQTASSSVIRTQSLISPNRTSGSKGATTEEEVKKEKKSKFRTPSFLRKRKEKKEAANKDKTEK